MILPGIDISHWDFDAGRSSGTQINAVVAAGIQFIFAKASEGITYVDPSWAFHKRKLLHFDGTIQKGAYHWLIKDGNEDLQCDHFLDQINVSRNANGWLIGVDIEGDDGYGFAPPDFDSLKKFATRFWLRNPGHPLFLYTRKTYWGAVGGGNFHAFGGGGIALLWNADGTQISPITLSNFDSTAAGLKFGADAHHPYAGDYAGFSDASASTILQFGRMHAAGVKFDGDAFKGTMAQLRALALPPAGSAVVTAPSPVDSTWSLLRPTIISTSSPAPPVVIVPLPIAERWSIVQPTVSLGVTPGVWSGYWSIKVDGIELNDFVNFVTQVPEIEHLQQQRVILSPVDGDYPAYIRSQPMEAPLTFLIAMTASDASGFDTKLAQLRAIFSQSSYHTVQVQIRGMPNPQSMRFIVESLSPDYKTRTATVQAIAPRPVLS